MPIGAASGARSPQWLTAFNMKTSFISEAAIAIALQSVNFIQSCCDNDGVITNDGFIITVGKTAVELMRYNAFFRSAEGCL